MNIETQKYCVTTVTRKILRGDGEFTTQRTQMQLSPQHHDRDAGLAIGVVSVQDPAASQNDVDLSSDAPKVR
jgi:hypothetical protein